MTSFRPKSPFSNQNQSVKNASTNSPNTNQPLNQSLKLFPKLKTATIQSTSPKLHQLSPPKKLLTIVLTPMHQPKNLLYQLPKLEMNAMVLKKRLDSLTK